MKSDPCNFCFKFISFLETCVFSIISESLGIPSLRNLNYALTSISMHIYILRHVHLDTYAYACMCAQAHKQIPTCTLRGSTLTYIHINAYSHTWICTHLHFCMHVHMRIQIPTYLYKYTYLYICVWMDAYTCMYSHKQTHLSPFSVETSLGQWNGRQAYVHCGWFYYLQRILKGLSRYYWQWINIFKMSSHSQEGHPSFTRLMLMISMHQCLAEKGSSPAVDSSISWHGLLTPAETIL